MAFQPPIRLAQFLFIFSLIVACTKEESSVSLATQLADLELTAVVTLFPEPDPTSPPDPSAPCPAVAYSAYRIEVIIPRVQRCPMMNEIDLVVTRNGSPIKDAILESDIFTEPEETGECRYTYNSYHFGEATYAAKIQSSVLPLPSVTLPSMPTKASTCSNRAGSVEVRYVPKGSIGPQ